MLRSQAHGEGRILGIVEHLPDLGPFELDGADIGLVGTETPAGRKMAQQEPGSNEAAEAGNRSA
jgi:hypothetical protein